MAIINRRPVSVGQWVLVGWFSFPIYLRWYEYLVRYSYRRTCVSCCESGSSVIVKQSKSFSSLHSTFVHKYETKGEAKKNSLSIKGEWIVRALCDWPSFSR